MSRASTKDPAGPVLAVEADYDEPKTLKLPGGTAVILSRPSPVPDRINQDAAAILGAGDESHLLVVADGMGGTRQGGAAAAALVRQLAAQFTPPDPAKPVRAAILDGIEGANAEIHRDLPGSGTTLAAVEITGTAMRGYHIGDSSIFVVGQRGKLKLRSVSHSPVGFAVEAGLLGEDEALLHDELHLVSNMVGSPEMRIELGAPLELARFDTVLVASDGLTDNLTVSEIIESIRKGPLREGVARLVELALSRMNSEDTGQPGKPDDLSLIAYRRDRSQKG
ncbi:serine/threonine phosphatase [Haloferula helveola]|uniref:Serine/threonine phosphatase n=1 Tax=Haloferula helveola TaxID=490095 RepID=A0ABN6GZQ4_9BACT|nr:serine/threonine phosphatase [Haloferula helveola]